MAKRVHVAKRVLVILGHPDKKSFCSSIATAYSSGARGAGHEVRLISLGSLAFDPVLRGVSSGGQELEPDLLEAQESIRWAQHIAFVYPIWWGAPPALVKGFLDRVLQPGFAFEHRPGARFRTRLLKGRSARLLVTMDSPPWYYRWVSRMPGHHQMKRCTLRFCGIRPVRISSFGPMKNSERAQRARWLDQVSLLGAQA